MLVYNEGVNFRGLHGVSRTRLRIYVEGQTVVLAVTELPDNPGTSVTNSWGGPVDLAKQLLRFIPESIPVDPASIIWVEHYPARGGSSESFDRVFMTWDGKRYRMNETVHPWRRMTETQFTDLVGGLRFS